MSPAFDVCCCSASMDRLEDVVAHCENKVTIDFPIIADESREIAVKYGEWAAQRVHTLGERDRRAMLRESVLISSVWF